MTIDSERLKSGFVTVTLHPRDVLHIVRALELEAQDQDKRYQRAGLSDAQEYRELASALRGASRAAAEFFEEASKDDHRHRQEAAR
jgi:hypothetical protein